MDLLPPPGSGSAAEADFNEAIASKQLQYSLEYCPLSVESTLLTGSMFQLLRGVTDFRLLVCNLQLCNKPTQS
jgi:hypothetical protein